MLGVAHRTVAKWIDAGELRGYRLPTGNKERRTRAEWIIEFCDRRELPRPQEIATFAVYVGDTDDFHAACNCMTAAGLPSVVVTPQDAIERIAETKSEHVFVDVESCGDVRIKALQRKIGNTTNIHLVRYT